MNHHSPHPSTNLDITHSREPCNVSIPMDQWYYVIIIHHVLPQIWILLRIENLAIQRRVGRVGGSRDHLLTR